MTRTRFHALIEQRLIQLDGATGTELVKRGMPAGVCPEAWVLEHPEALAAVQQAYAASGSDLVYAPTFGGNPLKLAEFDLEKHTGEINRKLAEISRRAVPGKLVFGDIAPTGQLVEPFGPLPFEKTVELYKEQVRGLIDGGVDGFAIETMMDLQEARAALIAVRELCDLPAIVTLTFEPGGRTLTGVHPVSALVTLQAIGADAFGCNCSTGPAEMAEVIRVLKPYAAIPLVAKPNAGMPHLVDGETRFDLAPEPFAEAAVALIDAGANLLGGCCGTSPAHLAALHKKISTGKPLPARQEKSGVVSSPSSFRRLAPEEPFAIIGERINPTGKKALQAELRAGKFDLVRDFAREQSAQGAALLDVNFGLSGIDETAMMRTGVTELVRIGSTPLCIDSTRPETVEAALRLYPGRALLNSISAEKERLEKVLPIAAKYGAMLILLPLTDDGIPESSGARIEALDKLLDAWRAVGGSEHDCVVDALVMTVSADPAAAVAALDFIDDCSRRRGLATVCGLSNVSFGLPNRPAVNAAFLGLAIGRGLDSAIANPAAAGIRETVIAADALLGKDRELEHLLVAFSDFKPGAATAAAASASGESRCRRCWPGGTPRWRSCCSTSALCRSTR